VAYDTYLISVLTAVIRVLQKQRFDFAIAGGLAYSALVTPRATVDIDVLVLIPARPPTDLFEGLRSALARKGTVDFSGMVLPIVTIEDLVLLKALAGRPQDRADIDGVLAGQESALDRAYLESWARRLDVDLGALGKLGSS